MKLHNHRQKTGHLIAFIGKDEKKDNFSIFFPVSGLEQFDSLLKITEGFKKSFNEFEENEKYFLTGYSVNDIGRAHDIFPEFDESRMVRFEVIQFFDEQSNFIDGFAEIIIKRLVNEVHPIFPDIRTGSMASGANFFNRQKEIKELWEKVSSNNLLLQAPRRYGKSSFLNYISKHPAPGWTVCFVDLEGGKSSEDFIELIVDRLMRSKECNSCLPAHLSSFEIWKEKDIEKLKKRREERKQIKSNWKDYGKTLFDSMNSNGNRLLLILDECSFLLEDMIEAQDVDSAVDLLSWFHDERIRATNISFILSGSEHLPEFLSSYDIDSHFLEDLKPMHLRLFDSLTAQKLIFLAFAGEGIAICLPEIKQMLSLMGKPVPYFLQLFIDTLSTACRSDDEITLEQMEAIYYEKLLGPESKRYFESIEQQLERYKRYGSEAYLGAQSILNLLSVNEYVELGDIESEWIGATSSKIKFNTILTILKDDFYIENKDGRVYFLSKLIKEWWERHGSSLKN